MLLINITQYLNVQLHYKKDTIKYSVTYKKITIYFFLIQYIMMKYALLGSIKFKES